MMSCIHEEDEDVLQLVDKLVSFVSASPEEAKLTTTTADGCGDVKDPFDSSFSCSTAAEKQKGDLLKSIVDNQVTENHFRRKIPFLRRADKPPHQALIDVLPKAPLANCRFANPVGYVFSTQLIAHTNRLPKVAGRAFRVHSLMQSYGLLHKLHTIPAFDASESQLRSFHSEEYIETIKESDAKCSKGGANLDSSIHNNYELDVSISGEEYGLAYDCAPVSNMYQLISSIAGGTLAAVNAVATGLCKVALNWTGGWHHAHRDEASGYCYVNDIVIGILELLSRGFERVIYIDFDLHHGDGVEAAFAHTSKVLTISFHKHEVGFFPGTGSLKETGWGNRGKGYAVNVPLRDGITDGNFSELCNSVINEACRNYKPQIIIGQFGADTLIGDPMNGFNLTLEGPANCLRNLLLLNLPMVLLGGGGYHHTNTARLWAYLTSIVAGVQLPLDIPDHEFFLEYRPSYELAVEACSTRKDSNSNEHLKSINEAVLANLQRL